MKTLYYIALQVLHKDLAARSVFLGEGKMCKIGFFGYAQDVVEYRQHKRAIKVGKTDASLAKLKQNMPRDITLYFNGLFQVKSKIIHSYTVCIIIYMANITLYSIQLLL